MKEQKFEYGMIGLGTIGRNLVYNMYDHGFSGSGFEKNIAQVAEFNDQEVNDKVFGNSNL